MIDNHHGLIKEALLARIKLLCSGRVLKGVDAVKSLHCDPVRLFIKMEPHKLQKLLQGRFRLISSVSLIDSLVERVLYQRRAKLEIRSWDSIPSKPGMGASDDSINLLAAEIVGLLHRYGVVIDDDVAGWDWELKWFLLCAAIFADMIVMGVRFDSDYGRCLRSREAAAAYPVLADSAGYLYSLLHPVMTSGRFVTSYRNSRARVILGTLAGTQPMAMGDDCNESPINKVVAPTIKVYESLGYPRDIFEYIENRRLDGTIFCSMRFYHSDAGVSAEPVRWLRSLYRLLSKKYTHADLAQFEYEVRNCREYNANDGLRAYLHANVAEVGSPQITL